MGLSLVVGPAHAGKVGLLLDRFLERIELDPWLIVPNRAEVERVERELVARVGALLAGRIATFDDLFEHLAHGDGEGRRLLDDAERAFLVRRAASATSDLAGRFPGFADAAARALAELDGSLVEADALEGDLARIVAAYRSELERVDAWDRGALRARAVERLTSHLDAWDGRPVLAYGFEDLTGAEWRLLEALAARTDVHVSLPYEPGRAAYASLSRTAADLSAIAADVVELPPASERHLPAALAHLERSLFVDRPSRAPLHDGAIAFLEGAGERGTLELVAEEALRAIRSGAAPERIAVVCPSVDAVRIPLEAAFAALGVPVSLEAPSSLRATPLGHSLLSLLRFAWFEADRRALYAHLRSPYSGLPRRDVDWVEGMLRGRGVITAPRTVEVTRELRGGRSLPTLDVALGSGPPTDVVRDLVAAMARHAHGTTRPPVGGAATADLRAHDAVVRALDALDRLAAHGVVAERSDVVHALERLTVAGDRARSPGRVAVLDLLRARTRRFDVVVVVGLEQGSLPRRGRISPLLDDELRARLDERRGARLGLPDQASRDRYLFTTACTRPTTRLVLARQAVGDEGTPREASPFWDAVRELFDPDDVRRATVRRSLSATTRDLEDAPTERERLRALAVLATEDAEGAEALAVANGWERRLRRAERAFDRPTRISHPRALELLAARDAYSVSDLERMAGCSSAWFVERYIRPGTIDRGVDRMLRGIVMHTALQRFYQSLPRAIPGAERVTPENVEDAVRLVRESLRDALDTGMRIDVDELERRELEQGLGRDLEQLVRAEAESPSHLVTRKVEHGFRGYELAPGVAISGKIDRVDADPMSARGIVVDYKSGAASSAADIAERDLMQIPLYMLVLRDQLGLEPMGGVYVPVGGGRRPRGMLRAGADAVPGFVASDYLDDETFDGVVEEARATAVGLVERIRAGDVRHDPQGGDCPHWCELWRICRKPRA